MTADSSNKKKNDDRNIGSIEEIKCIGLLIWSIF